MFRLSFIITTILVILLVWTGVLEVRVHPEKLGNVSSTLAGVFSHGDILQTLKVQAIKIKREGELWLIKEDNKKVEVVTKYVKKDSDDLGKILEENKDDPKKILPQVELLSSSIKRLRDLEKSVTDETIKAYSGDFADAFSQAQKALDRLKEVQKEQEKLQEKFNEATWLLEDGVKEQPTPEATREPEH